MGRIGEGNFWRRQSHRCQVQRKRRLPIAFHPVEQVAYSVCGHAPVLQGQLQSPAQPFLPYLVLKSENPEELFDAPAIGMALLQEGQSLAEGGWPRIATDGSGLMKGPGFA